MLKKLFFNQFMLTLVIMFVGVGVIALVVTLFAQDTAEREAEVIDLNDGYGTEFDPIPAGAWINFPGYQMQIQRVIDPADQMILEMNLDNPLPQAGYRYILLWVEVDCQRESCQGEMIGEQFELFAESPTPIMMTRVDHLDDNLLREVASRNEQISGWLPFQVPINREIYAAEITDFDERVSVYAYLPDAEE